MLIAFAYLYNTLFIIYAHNTYHSCNTLFIIYVHNIYYIYEKSIDPSQYNTISSDEVGMIHDKSYDRMLDALDAAEINEGVDVSSVFSLPQGNGKVSLPPMAIHHNLFSYPNRQDGRFLKYIVHSDDIQDKDSYFNWKLVNEPVDPEDASADYLHRYWRIIEFIGNFVLYGNSSIEDRYRYNRLRIHYMTDDF